MAVVRSRIAAATWAALLTRIRSAVGDPASTAYTSVQLTNALQDQVNECHRISAARSAAEALVSVERTYTAAAESIPLFSVGNEAPGPSEVVRIEDVTDTDPVEIQWISPRDIETQRRQDSVPLLEVGRYFTIYDTNLMLRPIPTTDLTLRIWYVANPFAYSAGAGNQHPLRPENEELLVIGAAVRLQEINDQVPVSRRMRYLQMLADYTSKARRRGPIYYRDVQNVRY